MKGWMLPGITTAVFLAAVLGAYSTWPISVLAQLLVLGAFLACLLPVRSAVTGYLTTLAIQIPQSTGLALRPAIADLFLIPAIVRIALRDPRSLRAETNLFGPLVLLSVSFLVAAVIGYANIGRLTGYVLFNKLIGIGLLIAGALVMTRVMRTVEDLRWVLRTFIVGVSVTNLLVLLVIPIAYAGWSNPIYLPGSYRLFGTLLNPTAYGGIIVTAAMLELGLLRQPLTSGRWTALRWLNVWILGLCVAMTLSRSTWLSAGVAAGTLLALQIFQPRPRVRTGPLFWGTATVWTVLPALVMGAILYTNRGVELMKDPEVRAAELQKLIAACAEQPHPICEGLKGSKQQSGETQPLQTGIAAPPPGAASSRPAPDPPATPAKVEPVVDSSVALSVDGPMMNARGFQDRFAIIGVAWKDYARSTSRMLTGIGLGTFFETSEDDFGVPLIIHNTYAWFLIELGPLGFVAFLWLMGLTAWSLWRTWLRGGVWRQLSSGAIAAFAGILVFFMFNEGFYQRHFWLVFVIADRLRALSAVSSESVIHPVSS